MTALADPPAPGPLTLSVVPGGFAPTEWARTVDLVLGLLIEPMDDALQQAADNCAPGQAQARHRCAATSRRLREAREYLQGQVVQAAAVLDEHGAFV